MNVPFRSRREERSAAGDRLRLLVVDDDEVDRLAVRRALRAAPLDVEVTEARSAEVALELLAAGGFDCMLLDLILPGRDGRALLEELRLRSLAVPAVVLTGQGDEELAVELLRAGAADYLPKSALGPERLQQAILHAIELGRARLQAQAAEAARDRKVAQLQQLAEAATSIHGSRSVQAVLEETAARARAIVGCSGARATVEVLVPTPEQLAVPLRARSGEVLGTLVLEGATPAFTASDRAIAVQLAQLAAVAIENARLLELAQRAARARDEMMAVVSHDLRNPLNVVVMCADAAMRRFHDAPGMVRTMERVLRAADQMQRLISDLLDISRIDAGRFVVDPTPRPLAPLLEELRETFGPLAERDGIRLEFDVQPVSSLPLDGDRMLQVFSNLVGNAIKFSPAGGRVVISGGPEGGSMRFTVRDSGPGIAPSSSPASSPATSRPGRPPTWARGWGSTSPARSWKPTAARSAWRTSPGAAPASGSRSPSTRPVASGPPPVVAHGLEARGAEPLDRVTTSKRGAERLRAGHPWIYRSDLQPDPGATVANGSAVEVVDGRGKVLGTAFYSVHSQIALRLLTREPIEVDRAFLRTRLASALEMRQRVLPGVRDVRLVHGEADFLPGLVVDRYGDHLSIQTLIPGTERRKELIADLLEELLAPASIVERNDVRSRTLEGLEMQKGVLRGTYRGPIVYEEGSARLETDLLEGQKTGAFLDQRENHVLAGDYARGRALDLFSYVGGFALQLARNADSVKAVEISSEACARIEQNARLSSVSGVEAVEANVFDWLRDELAAGARYDTIVLDPPAFAKNKAALDAALRGYKEVNLRALQLLAPGGVLVTCTCSYHVSAERFEEMVADAARDARREVQVIERRGAGRDHPMLLPVPETRYLKCLVMRAV